MNTSIELNRKLYREIQAPEIDFDSVRRLLDEGADPLGHTEDEDEDDYEIPLDEAFCEAQSDVQFVPSEKMKQIPKLVELFYEYGMDLASCDDDVLHTMTWLRNDYALKTLNCILNHGLPPECADCFVEDQIGDILQFEDNCFSPSSKEWPKWVESVVYALKGAMLIAAYNTDNIDYCLNIKALIEPQHNNPSVLRDFKKWDDYEYIIDFSQSHSLLGRPVHIYKTGTKDLVWAFTLSFS